MMNDNAPVGNLEADQGKKGPMPSGNGEVGLKGMQAIKRAVSYPSNGYDANNGPAEAWEGEVRGGNFDKFGDAGERSGCGADTPAPIWTDGRSLDKDAVNAMGAVGDTGSDPMFDRFKTEKTGWGITDNRTDGGTNSGDSVSSDKLSGDTWGKGADSDPEFENYPAKGSDEERETVRQTPDDKLHFYNGGN